MGWRRREAPRRTEQALALSGDLYLLLLYGTLYEELFEELCERYLPHLGAAQGLADRAREHARRVVVVRAEDGRHRPRERRHARVAAAPPR